MNHTSPAMITVSAASAESATNVSNELSPFQIPFSPGAAVFATVLLSLMGIFGLFANLITMIVIAKSEKLKSIFNYLLVSLCLSDMLSAFSSPLVIYRETWGFEEWQTSGGLCKASFAIDTWTSYVTTLHILLFAILRLISIQWPMKYKAVTVFHVRILIISIWILGLAGGFIPFFVMFTNAKRDRFGDGPDAKWSHCALDISWIDEFLLYYQITFPFFIYIPMAAICILCPTIGIIIYRRRNILSAAQADKRQRRKEKHAVMQLGFITSSFLMGYIPNTVYIIYTLNVIPESQAMLDRDWNIYMMSYMFLRFSECLNPIFYNIASSKMRKETFELMGKCRFGRKRDSQITVSRTTSSREFTTGRTTSVVL